MKNGDKVTIKNHKGSEGIVKGFRIKGCQLHGDPIEVVIVDVKTAGHNLKKGHNYEFHEEDLVKI